MQIYELVIFIIAMHSMTLWKASLLPRSESAVVIDGMIKSIDHLGKG